MEILMLIFYGPTTTAYNFWHLCVLTVCVCDANLVPIPRSKKRVLLRECGLIGKILLKDAEPTWRGGANLLAMC